MASGATGRGTFQSVIAGASKAHAAAPRRYHVSAWDHILESILHRRTQHAFLVRDAVFDAKFPEAAAVNGTFRLTPSQRHAWHSAEVMPAVRRRSIALARLRQQRAVNASLLADPATAAATAAVAAATTADAAAYFAPRQHRGSVTQPDWWKHPTNAALVPRPQWRRHPELGGITRVDTAMQSPSTDF